jgi:hypothetical protein
MLHDLYAPTMGKLSLAGLSGSPPGDVPPSIEASHTSIE